jgi:hypothetical protein
VVRILSLEGKRSRRRSVLTLVTTWACMTEEWLHLFPLQAFHDLKSPCPLFSSSKSVWSVFVKLLLRSYIFKRAQDQLTVISVDKRTRLKTSTLENRDSICDACEDFPFIHPIRTSLLLLSLRIKGMGHDSNHWPPCSAGGATTRARKWRKTAQAQTVVNIHINAFRLVL